MGNNDQFDTTTWRGLSRLLACTWPAWMLAPSIRRQAARDPLLEWDEQRRTYRRRRSASASPQSRKQVDD